jgi:protease PrsW
VLDARRFGRTPVIFVVGLGACCLIALIALIIAVHGGPVPAVTGLALALLPVPLVLAGLLYLDRLEPEPRALLAAMFGAGAGVAALIALAGRALGTGVITVPELGPDAGRAVSVTVTAALGGALVAETMKGAVLLALLAFRRPELDGAHDGVVYAGVTGLGFALIANLYACAQAERSGFGALASAFARRGVLGPLWDPLFSSMIGIGITYAAMRRGSRGYWAIGAGWAAAVGLDALWNSSVTGGAGRLVAVDLILIVALAVVGSMVLADRRRIIRLITGFLPGYADTGALASADVEMLASMYWRRMARQWARLHCGLPGLHAMAEYQLAATELALACNRDRRGLMAPAVFARRREDSLSMMRAAAAVFREREFPPPHPPWAPDGECVFVPGKPDRYGG